MALKKWDEIRVRSKITLEKETAFDGLCNGEEDTLIPKGTYYINGFWANSCGISIIKDSEINDYGFYSIQLKKFEEVSE